MAPGFQEKALEKLNHSKRAQQRKRRTELFRLGVDDGGDDEGEYRGKPAHTSLAEACRAGDWRYVGATLDVAEDAGRSVLQRNPGALHEACWEGRARVVKLLAKYAPRQMVDRRDETGTTPLVTVCRTFNNPITTRISILKSLLSAGADVTIADKNGDTALHWLARQGNLLLAKALFAGSARAVLLLERSNARGRVPYDIAARREDVRFATLLRRAAEEGALKRKVAIKADAAAAEAEACAERQGDILAHALERTLETLAEAQRVCTARHNEAELRRRAAEKEVVRTAMASALEEARAWLQGPYGANEAKLLAKTIRRDLEERRQGQQEDPEAAAREARQRAVELLIKRKQNEAKAKAIADFRERNPPVVQRGGS